MSGRTLLLCSGFGILICSLPTPLLESPRPLYGTANDRSCQVCHPGSTNGLRASVHGVLLELPDTAEQACTVCHGDLTEHRAIARSAVAPIPAVPAVEIEACNACHDGEDWPTSLGAHPWPGAAVHREHGAPISRLPEQGTGLDWSGLLTLGYRFVSRSGSRGRYRTDINLEPGLRLLEADVEARGRGDSWADLLRLQMNGLEDPYTDASFEVSKDGGVYEPRDERRP